MSRKIDILGKILRKTIKIVNRKAKILGIIKKTIGKTLILSKNLTNVAIIPILIIHFNYKQIILKSLTINCVNLR